MELNKYLKKYLPSEISAKFRTLDGRDIKKWLQQKGYDVVSNEDTGTTGLATTSSGICVTSNGYVYIQ